MNTDMPKDRFKKYKTLKLLEKITNTGAPIRTEAETHQDRKERLENLKVVFNNFEEKLVFLNKEQPGEWDNVTGNEMRKCSRCGLIFKLSSTGVFRSNTSMEDPKYLIGCPNRIKCGGSIFNIFAATTRQISSFNNKNKDVKIFSKEDIDTFTRGVK